VSNNLDLLQTLKKVSAPENLYEEVVAKINIKKNQNLVNLGWFRAVAAVFALVFSLQILIFVQKNKKAEEKSIEKLISLNNNQLYNE
jgi:hypothetical protein